jgi:hypothetical protein
MNALTCSQVQGDIELFAAGECDPATSAAIEQHTASCAACAQALEESRHMLGLLTLRLAEPAALERLRQQIRVETKKHRRPTRMLFAARVAALAAALLVTVGLYTWIASFRSPGQINVVAANISACPGADYTVHGSHEIEVRKGEVFFQVEPSAKDQRFTVKTPAGVVTMDKAECIVKVSPGQANETVAVKVWSGKVTLSNAKHSVEARRGETAFASRQESPTRQVEDMALRFGRSYRVVPVKSKGGVPAYPLPLDLTRIENYESAAKELPLAQVEKNLRSNGFAVLPGWAGYDLVSPYAALADRGMPQFVTADTILHLHRLQLSDTLREIEDRLLAADLAQLTTALAAKVRETPVPPDNAKDWQSARGLALTYLAVGQRLLRPDAPLPDGADTGAVTAIVRAVEAGQALRPVHDFGYAADFAGFRPVGHYAANDKLQRYYRAMMWYGRMPLLLAGGTPAEARRQTMAATLLASAVHQAKLGDGRKALDVWTRIYAVTSFFVGLSDEPGPQQYYAALTQAAGDPPALNELAAQDGQQKFQRELMQFVPRPLFANVAKAPPSLPSPATGGGLFGDLGPETGFRLMGQRFAPDAFALGKLVYPNVGPGNRKTVFTAATLPDGRIVRGLPRGLDLMALLGSSRARQILHFEGDDDYRGSFSALSYDSALARLATDLHALDVVDCNRNLYWSWLYALEPLLSEHAAGHPTFMTAPAYEARLLNTALASWTQLRRDTALYTRKGEPLLQESKLATTKEVDAGAIPAPWRGAIPLAYLEPLPELYGRLLALTRMAAKELADLQVLSPAARSHLDQLEKQLERILALAEKELADQALSADDQDFLRHLPGGLRPLAAAPNETRLDTLAAEVAAAKKVHDDKRLEGLQRELYAEAYGAVATPLVVTIATDVTGKVVLQQGIGKADLALFVLRLPGGKLVLAAGPVLSYYEMKRPRSEPLTDVAWLRRLAQDSGPDRPAWTQVYLGNAAKK